MPYVVFYGTSGGIVGRNGEISGNNIIWRARGDGEDRGSPGVGPRHAPGFASTGWNIALICAGTMLLVPLSSRWQPRNRRGKSNPGRVIVFTTTCPPTTSLLRFENYLKTKNSFRVFATCDKLQGVAYLFSVPKKVFSLHKSWRDGLKCK